MGKSFMVEKYTERVRYTHTDTKTDHITPAHLYTQCKKQMTSMKRNIELIWPV